MSAVVNTNMFAELENDRALLARGSTAERVAEILRTKIMEGLFLPGTRLPEETIASTLSVSRNTVREAFRLLSHERLASHELNRGVFVSDPTVEDLIDLYRVRRLAEGSAARMVSNKSLLPLDAIGSAVEEGRAAAKAGRWQDAGTADINFHQAVVSLAGSQRMNDLMRTVLTELRLVFHVMDDPERFHGPYLERNVEIFELLKAGDGLNAEQTLLRYLDDAESQLLEAYKGRHDHHVDGHKHDRGPIK